MKLGIYKHYKGNLYHVFGLCRHSETLEAMVMYQSLYGDYGFWVRPLAIFESTTTIDGVEQPRFAFQKDVSTTLAQVRE